LLELALHLPKTLFVLELFEFVHFDLLFNLFMSLITEIKDHISCSNSVSPTDLELEAKESVSASYILRDLVDGAEVACSFPLSKVYLYLFNPAR
jgi:hypothetical protein